MDKHFRLPASKKCTWIDCENTVGAEDEIQILFQGKTLLLSLCPTCHESLPTNMKFKSFSGNGYRYVESIYPA